VTSFIQSEDDWLDCAPYQDFVAYVQVTELFTGGAAPATLYLEGAPLKENVLFAPTGGTHASLPLSVGTNFMRNILCGQEEAQIPVARWLRWRIAMNAPSTTWSVTFQIHLAVHSMCLPAVG
jgi:hypothetical protein